MPRRIRIDLFSPAEKAIYDATQAVEAMPPHPFLTEAVILLGQAREKVADYVDSHDGKCSMCGGSGRLQPSHSCPQCSANMLALEGGGWAGQ